MNDWWYDRIEWNLMLLWEESSVPYPELFWSWYTGLGSQTQTPKYSKVLISGVSFCQHSLLQSQESNVLSYSECKIAKTFQGFAPGPHWGGLTALPQTSWLHNGFSLCFAHRKTSTPIKLLDTALGLILQNNENYSEKKYVDLWFTDIIHLTSFNCVLKFALKIDGEETSTTMKGKLKLLTSLLIDSSHSPAIGIFVLLYAVSLILVSDNLGFLLRVLNSAFEITFTSSPVSILCTISLPFVKETFHILLSE